MNPADQTDSWSGSILFAIQATQEYKQMIKQMTKVVTGKKRVNVYYYNPLRAITTAAVFQGK